MKALRRITKHHGVRDIRFEDNTMLVTIDGEGRSFELREVSGVLLNASEEDRGKYEISPSGYGIHWPVLDEDLAIDGLQGIVHEPTEVEAKKPSKP